ncbi:MAG TPA: hypothetical protein ENL18_01775 [Thermoplasmatales archaeon]|nr:hypothetical protein [Thermoplasmatales archaeon]
MDILSLSYPSSAFFIPIKRNTGKSFKYFGSPTPCTIIYMIAVIAKEKLKKHVHIQEGGKMKVMENDLRGKRVMSDEGMYLGTLRNITVDEKTGLLESLLVEPSDKIDPRLYQQDEDGYLLFPFESVKSVRDVIVVGEE